MIALFVVGGLFADYGLYFINGAVPLVPLLPVFFSDSSYFNFSYYYCSLINLYLVFALLPQVNSSYISWAASWYFL